MKINRSSVACFQEMDITRYEDQNNIRIISQKFKLRICRKLTGGLTVFLL